MSAITGQFNLRRVGLLWLASAIVLLILALYPSTGWLVRRQAQSLKEAPGEMYALLSDVGVRDLPGKPTEPPPSSTPAPGDYDAQLIAALKGANHQAITEQLRVLASRFPDRPGALAHALRYASSRLSFSRDEDYLISGDQVRQRSTYSEPATPEQFQAFDRDAAAGERLDPKNAFFPLMRAVGLFGSHRDDEALAALERASERPRWDDYSAEEVKSAWKERERRSGRQSSLHKMVALAAVLFPHYAKVRQLARIATYKAILLEQAGKREEGLKIRLAVARCSDKMRVQSQNMIGSLVGIAVNAISTSRPGGALPEKKPDNVEAEGWAQHRMDAYAAYLNSTGHRDDAARARSAMQAGKEAKEVLNKGLDLSPSAGRPMIVLIGWWIAGMVVLANALWMLLMAGASALLARVQAKLGAVLGILAIGLLILGAIAYPISQRTEAMAMFTSVMDNLSSSSSGPSGTFSPGAAKLLTVGIAMVAPLIISLGALIWAGSRRGNPAAALCRALSISALILTLAYAGIVTNTARKEDQVSAGLEQILNGEGKYLAKLSGKPWPGPVY